MVDSAGTQPRNIPRSIAAVVIGFVAIGALAFGTDAAIRYAVPGVFTTTGRVDDVRWLLFFQAYVFIYATFGCWLCARLAPNRPMHHALILGVLGLAFNIMGTIAMWGTAPAWYHIVALALVMPAAWLGGWIAERRGVAAPMVAA